MNPRVLRPAPKSLSLPPVLLKLPWVVLLGGLSLWTWGCRSEPDLVGDLQARLIVAEPETLLRLADLFPTSPRFDWDVTDPVEIARWRVTGATEGRPGARGWRISLTNRVRLVREVEIEASELDRVEVEVTAGGAGELALYWAGAGQRFGEARSLHQRVGSARPTVVEFEVAEAATWRGPIRRLRIDLLPARTPSHVTIRAIRGSQRRPGATLETPSAYKVEVANEVRNGLVIAPGHPLRSDLLPGPGRVLSVGLAAVGRDQGEFSFEVAIEAGDHEEILFEKALTSAEASRGWHDVVVPLPHFPGQTGSLRLTTRVESVDSTRALPVWGNPEILGPGGSQAARPNVILISIDTLRADRLSLYGHPRPTSPHLEAWAQRDAVTFRNVVAQAPWTLPSQASMFSGLDALTHGHNHYGTADPGLELIAETLRRAGYTTGAVTGGGYLRPEFGLTQGFDTLAYWPEILSEHELAWGIDRAKAWLERNAHRQFFFFFHTYEVHGPHRRRQPYFDRLAGGAEPPVRGRIEMRAREWAPGQLAWDHDYFTVTTGKEEVEHLTESEKEAVGLMYDSAIAYVDHEIRGLFDFVDQLGLAGRTLIVLTSDHGEALGEADRAGHNYLEDYNLMVPLILELPDRAGAGRVVETQVRSIDIVPTVLEVVGVAPGGPLDGESVLDLATGRSSDHPAEAWSYASSANLGVSLRLRDRLKYRFNNTAWSPLLGREALYDLRQDPGETRDLGPESPQTTRLRQQVREAFAERHRGLRLRLSNPTRGRLEGALRGGWAKVGTVKSTDEACQCLTWRTGQPPAFDLGPGDEVALYFEGEVGAHASLSAAWISEQGARVALTERLGVAELTGPRTLLLGAAGWGWVEGRAPGVGFTLEPPAASSRTDREIPSEAEEQLRALGYVQ